jgi:Zn-finger nucleic acid-binding protein
LLFRGVKHCAACGASADAPAHVATEQGQSERQCPRCSASGPAPLDAQLVAETLLDQCPDCGGLWVDQTAFERLTREAESATTAGALGTLPRPHRKTDSRASKVTYLRCPDCESLMNRRNYGKRSGVIVDVCSAHGIWFDDKELTRVLEFVRSGGLQETRRRETEDLREERRRLESLRATDRTLGGSRIGAGAFFGEGRMGEADLLDVVRVLTRIF